jgi:hypothetical protein
VFGGACHRGLICFQLSAIGEGQVGGRCNRTSGEVERMR